MSDSSTVTALGLNAFCPDCDDPATFMLTFNRPLTGTEAAWLEATIMAAVWTPSTGRSASPALISAYEQCARIAELVVKMVPKGLGSAHGPEGQLIMAESAQWIADEIRALAKLHLPARGD